jgi:hypothetical protein
MFEYDICLCGNGDKCPSKDTCRRYVYAQKKGMGIFTMALLYTGEEKCEDYYPLKKEGDKDVK